MSARKRADDPRSSEELLEAHRIERLAEETHWDALWALRDRGTRHEFDMGRRLTESDHPRDREIGADLLAQLGAGERVFQDESVEILIRLLDDPDPAVVNSAAVGLGHRGDPRAVGPLVKLASRSEEAVRLGVAIGLLTHEDESAVLTLITLSSDPAVDVRSWATFGLGTQIDVDTPAIRDALTARLEDEDPEVRGEALVGLACRHDERVLRALPAELEKADVVVLALEAAETLAVAWLVPHLERLLVSLGPDANEYFRQQLIRAIAACRGE